MDKETYRHIRKTDGQIQMVTDVTDRETDIQTVVKKK